MKIKFHLVILIIFFSLFCVNFSVAQDSSNATAIRVMENPSHFSALRWYQEKKFTGSPQSIVVDGYNGVRDGRTVYVNVANIVDTDTDNIPDKLFTNIYLISYNQDSGNASSDVFGKMLEHWKFNTNITTVGSCNITTTTDCVNNANCPTTEYCNSPKAKITRDTIRMERLADVNYYLEKYKIANGHYPELNAGTYVKNTSLSSWPSWQGTLAKELKQKLPEDTINKLGPCPPETSYNPKTCWDEKAKVFADSDLGDPKINLPANSNVFVYETNDKGSLYDLCATMETNYINTATGACDSSGANYNLNPVVGANHAPVFSGVNLPVMNSGLPYTGFLKATDADGDNITWTFDFSPTNQWSSWGGGVGAPPTVSTTDTPDVRKIFSTIVNQVGNYSFSATISDGTAVTTQNFTITIGNAPPTVLPFDINYIASSTNPVTIAFKAFDTLVDYPLGHTLSPPILFITSTIVNTFQQIAPLNTEYLFSFAGIFSTSTTGNIAGPKSFQIKVNDKWGATTTASFNVNVINDLPVITTPLNCVDSTRKDNPYPNCQIRATDVNGNAIIKYELTSSVTGISISNSGLISGAPTVSAGLYNIVIRVTDEYGARSGAVSYPLRVNTYCGDGITQNPNTEGLGGPTNNGKEDCDGNSNVALSPPASNLVKQYACAANCQFIGGYLGDGIIQDGTNGTVNQENCDLGIIDQGQRCQVLSGNGLLDLDGSALNCANLASNAMSGTEINELYAEICIDGRLSCLTDTLFSKLNSGCYLDKNANGKIDAFECDKGIFKCISGAVECKQEASWVTAAKDYCCLGKAVELAAQSVDIVDITLTGNGSVANPYVYPTCDEICRDWGIQQGYTKKSICVGVGLNNGAGVHDECVGSVHDEGGGNCQLAGNQTALNCKSLIFYDSWGVSYGETGYYNSVNRYAGNIYNTYAECEANSIKAEYHDVGYKSEFGAWVAGIDTVHDVGLLYTKRPCVFLPANTVLPALAGASYTTMSNPADKWWRAYFNKTASGNQFCLEGGKDYNKYSTSCYCQQMP